MGESEVYVPIDCNYYDRLEAWATLKERVTIKLHESEEPVEGIIMDLYVREKVEYLKLDSKEEIRLDKIVSVNDIPLATSCGI